jgi:predicted extracellular nuclease
MIKLLALLGLSGLRWVAAQNLIITELADPFDSVVARYVEMYSFDGAGQELQITEPNLYLARWTNGNEDPTTAIMLTDKTIGADGFLVLCVSDAGFNAAYGGVVVCDSQEGAGGPVDSNGDDQIAIIQGDPFASFTIVDIFGVPGEDGTGTAHEFEDGRAERKETATTAEDEWDVNDWNVFSDGPEGPTIINVAGLGVADMDPREWIGAGASGGSQPPSAAPTTAAPTTSAQPSSMPTPVPEHSIQEIQGDSSASPLEDTRVVVRLAYVTGVVYNGFFMQEVPTMSSDYSAGIFVFTSSEPTYLVKGDAVQVEGLVEERFGQTQLTDFADVTKLDATLFPPYFFQPAALMVPVADMDDFEKLEGMLVDIQAQDYNEIYISEYFDFDRFGDILVCAAPEQDGRIFQYTTRNAPSVSGYEAQVELLARSCLKIDDNNGSQNPAEPLVAGIYPITDTYTNSFRGGAQVTNLQGPLWFSFGDWRVAALTECDFDWDNDPNPREDAPKVTKADTVIAVANVLNYFVTLDERGADTEEEFERQAHKIILALLEMDADIFGLVEIENSPSNDAMENLVARLNIFSGRHYASASEGSIGDDAIRTGIVYDTDKYELEVVGSLGDSGVSISLLTQSTTGGIFDTNNSNRNPIAATLRYKEGGYLIRVVVNHFKSKGGSGTGLDDDIGDGAGNWNNQRNLAAMALLEWLEELE